MTCSTELQSLIDAVGRRFPTAKIKSQGASRASLVFDRFALEIHEECNGDYVVQLSEQNVRHGLCEIGSFPGAALVLDAYLADET